MARPKRQGLVAVAPAPTGIPAGDARDPLDAQRAALFVGRSAEIGMFSDLLSNPAGPRVVALTGIGGIGKTSLLHAWERHARDHGSFWVPVDGRDLPPNPAAFEAAVLPRDDEAFCCAAGRVIAVDAFEQLLPLEGWLRERFLPHVPADTIVILAGRWTPDARWRAEPGIARMLVECRLKALASEEAHDYLERRGVPIARRPAVQHFARGFPLALALAADWIERNPEADFSPAADPELIHPMVEWLLEDIGDDRRRHALEAGALVQYVTEPLLATMLEIPDATETFDWLARQNHVELHPQGLAVHDLVREPVVRELRWRDLRRYRELVRRACGHFLEGIEGTSAEKGAAAIANCLYSLREEPYVKHHFQPGNMEYYIDACRDDELPLLADMVATFEGRDAASRFMQWVHEAPDAVVVVRDRVREVLGLVLALRFDANDIDTGRESDDPGVAAFCRYIHAHAPLRGNRIAMFMRFAFARDTFQEGGPVWSHIATYGNGLYFTPGLAFFALAADTSHDWWGTGEHADSPLIPGTEFESGGRRFMLLAHDMRSEPPPEWARNCVDRILGEGPASAGTNSRPRILERSEFEDAVRHALRNFHDDKALQESVLHDSLLMSRESTDSGSLRRLLADTSREKLDDGTPRSSHRVLQAACFDPTVQKQTVAAEALSVSERTFRRRLRQAERQLIEQLWERETRWG